MTLHWSRRYNNNYFTIPVLTLNLLSICFHEITSGNFYTEFEYLIFSFIIIVGNVDYFVKILRFIKIFRFRFLF